VPDRTVQRQRGVLIPIDDRRGFWHPRTKGEYDGGHGAPRTEGSQGGRFGKKWKIKGKKREERLLLPRKTDF
jgi:hypothetical protein